MNFKDRYAAITQRQLLDIYHYDSETGILSWGSRGKYIGAGKFSTKYAGKLATHFDVYGYEQASLAMLMPEEPRGAKRIRHKIMAQNIIWMIVHGSWPEHMIDHADRNPSNNKLSNLREATLSQNAHNSSIRSDNGSGVRGVCWNKARSVWEAAINCEGKRIFLGYYHTLDEAAKVRLLAEVKYFGEFRPPASDELEAWLAERQAHNAKMLSEVVMRTMPDQPFQTKKNVDRIKCNMG
jgi:hypothetical protein